MRWPSRTPAAAPTLALRSIVGNLTHTTAGVTAWFELPSRVWAFRADRQREAWIESVAGQYAALAGSALHLRRTTRPYPVGNWAATLLRQASPTDRTAEDILAEHVQAAARHLDATCPVEPVTHLGVTVPATTSTGSRLLGLLRREATADTAAQVKHLTGMLTPPGLDAEPATEDALAWLLLRSTSLGLTPPDRHRGVFLDAAGLLDLTGRYRQVRTAYGSRVRYIDTVTGQEAHVAALTVGRMDEVEIPQRHDPWLHLADRAGFPVEISSRVVVVPPKIAAKTLHQRLLMIRAQQRDYDEKDLPIPGDLQRLADHAAAAGDEVTSGRPSEAARIHGWHRLAVWGATAEECEERAAALRDLYEQHARIELRRAPEQAPVLREFLPGEPVNASTVERWLPVQLWAAAVPQAVAEVGDRRGDLIGTVCGSGAPVMFDPHLPMEIRERSGLAVFVAEPGGGKSTLMGALAALAAIRGVRTTILDPSGPLAALANVPQLKGRVRVVNLTGADAGTLAPYALVPTPRARDYADPVEFERATRLAAAERKALAVDVCTMLLPPAMVKKPSTPKLLRWAVRNVQPTEAAVLDDVLQILKSGDSEAIELAELLYDAADLPLVGLLFGPPPADGLGVDAQLLVVTLAGLRLPDLTLEREHWSLEEQLAVPMLHCAHLLAAQRCYGGVMRSRKLLGLDEAHFMQTWASGRAFLKRLARDSRKWNLAALVASQNPRDILGLDVQNLVSTVFAGRIADDEEIAAEALRLLRVTETPDGRYGRQLAGLSQQSARATDRLGFREFLMRDVDGRVQKIRVDLSWSGLLEHLDTTPGGGAR